MAKDAVQPLGSMGTDTPLAVLSNKLQLLYNYFKQLFAQVTNPPIDCIREEIITSTETAIGSERNLLKPGPENCRLIELKSATIPILFKASDGPVGLEKAMEELCLEVSQAIAAGNNIVVLSDRGMGR